MTIAILRGDHSKCYGQVCTWVCTHLKEVMILFQQTLHLTEDALCWIQIR